MKICMIIKYPPIEGGVSMTAYWTARGLAERGHEVHVVTNADEVEPAYRIHMEPEDEPWLQPSFPNGGKVVLHQTTPYGPALSHIPAHNPMVTKLAGIAADIVRREDCQVIYGYYLEPYGLAAHLAAAWTGTPYIIRHAGSDLDRLMKHPDLAVAYIEVLRGAAAVVTTPALEDRFLALGVARGRICTRLPFGLPDRFNPQVPPLDLPGLVARYRTQSLLPADTPLPDPTRPTIGIYGKVGERKGSFDLVAALAALKGEGLEFNFVALTHGDQEPAFRQALCDAGLAAHTWVLPFVPHWQVAPFLRACTAVCFLERDFPIAIHGPVIAREILACGTCLILSGEIAQKQFYSDRIRDGENMLVVEDPRDHSALAERLRLVITSPEQAHHIGRCGHEISQAIEDYSAFTAAYDALLCAVASTGWPTQPEAQLQVEKAESSLRRAVLRHLPGSARLLGDDLDRLLARVDSDTVGWLDWQRAAHLAHWVGEQVAQAPSGYHGALPEVLEFEAERACLYAEPSAPAFVGRDRLGLRHIDEERVSDLRPLASACSRIVTFMRDVTVAFTSLNRHEIPPDLPPNPVSILFHRWPNMAVSAVGIDPFVAWLLCLSDGAHTCRDQLAALLEQAPQLAADLRAAYFRALRHLYRERYIIFV